MKTCFIVGLLLVLAFTSADVICERGIRATPLRSQTRVTQETQSNETPAHVQSEFEFTVHKRYQDVVPLFGGLQERCWAGEDWAPQFVYPAPASDRAGEVFTLTHGNSRSIWVNTALDLQAGHIQYVYFVPDAMTVLIDINVGRIGPSDTAVKVSYQRTALRAELNSHVAELARNDRDMGEHWASAIAGCLKIRK